MVRRDLNWDDLKRGAWAAALLRLSKKSQASIMVIAMRHPWQSYPRFIIYTSESDEGPPPSSLTI